MKQQSLTQMVDEDANTKYGRTEVNIASSATAGAAAATARTTRTE